MAEVRPLGTVETENEAIVVGVDHGKVALYFGSWLGPGGVILDKDAAQEFGRLYIAACWGAASDG